jgi:hypothetical protein
VEGLGVADFTGAGVVVFDFGAGVAFTTEGAGALLCDAGVSCVDERRPNRRSQKPGFLGTGVATGIAVATGFGAGFDLFGAGVVAPGSLAVRTLGSDGGGEMGAGDSAGAGAPLSWACVRSKARAAQRRKARNNRDMACDSERPYLRVTPGRCKAIPWGPARFGIAARRIS